MFERNIIHNNHLDLAYVCVGGQKRRTNDRLQVNRISRFDCRPAKSHERLPVGTCGHRQHTISNRVNACGQKRHTSCDKNNFPSKLTNQTGQKRHSYLHTVCVLQPVQPFTPDKFEDILDAICDKNNFPSKLTNQTGQKRHKFEDILDAICDKNNFPSKLTNQTGQKRHSYLHTVCVLQPVQPFTPDKFEDILDAICDKNNFPSKLTNQTGQKRHKFEDILDAICDKNNFPSKLTNQTGQKRHSYLHTVCVLQPVQPFTPDKFEDILDAITECTERHSITYTTSLPCVELSSERPKVLRRRQFWIIFTCTCAFRHSSRQFFHSRTSKNAPRTTVF